MRCVLAAMRIAHEVSSASIVMASRGRFYGNRKMFSTPLVLWLFALPSGIATRPSTMIGVFQCPTRYRGE